MPGVKLPVNKTILQENFETGVPGFHVGIQTQGILDQFTSVVWKWKSPIGLVGGAIPVKDYMDPYDLVRRTKNFGKTWHRRMVTSPNHHLWSTVWRLDSQIKAAEYSLEQAHDAHRRACNLLRDTLKFHGRHSITFHEKPRGLKALILKLFFGYTYPTDEWKFYGGYSEHGFEMEDD